MTSQRSGATQTLGEDSELHSRLFSSLFANRGDDWKPVILDLGPASPATVDYFGGFRCRLYFADLFDEPVVLGETTETTAPDLQQRFRELLTYPDGTQFDIILFWDILNYLTRPAVQALTQALIPYTHAGTRAHAFVTSRSTIAALPRLYRIREADVFLVHDRSTEQQACRAHPQAELKKVMRGFDIERGVLLRDGMQELLFRRV